MKNPSAQSIISPDDELYEILREEERKWEASLPRYSDKELLNIFPQIMDVAHEKINELLKKKNAIVKYLKDKLRKIQNTTADDFSKWFAREWLKVTIGKELLITSKAIKRFRRFIHITSNRPTPKGHITEDDIEQARHVPIQELLRDIQFRHTGKTLIGLCPLHKEKTPSFNVYLDSNRYYCYGCNAYGDSINLIQKLNNYNFLDAIRFLRRK